VRACSVERRLRDAREEVPSLLDADERTAASEQRRLLEGSRESEDVGIAMAPPDDL